MRKLSFVLAVCASTGAFAAPPDGYLSGTSCGLAEPVGIGVSLPIAPAGQGLAPVRRPGGVPADLQLPEIEQRIGAWLDRKLNYPDVLRVHCVSSGAFRTGLLDEVTVEIEGGKLDIVPLALAHLKLRNVTIDLRRLFTDGEVEVTASTPAEAHLEVSEDGLNEVLSSKAGKLHVETPRIQLNDGEVAFSARMKTLVIKNDVVTTGHFDVVAGSNLNFMPTSLKVGYLPLPSSALTALARRFNPIMDLTRLKPLRGIQFRIESVLVRPGKLILQTAHTPEVATAK